MALALYARLLERYPHLKTSPAVAVISPYQAQVCRVGFRVWVPPLGRTCA